MGLFNSTDIENAADDPFALKEGRQTVVITKSEEDNITLKDGSEVTVWRVTVANRSDDLEQDVLFWMEGDDKQMARTNTNIKKMLVALEIPTSQWNSISSNPSELEGLEVVVDAVKAKKSGNIYVNWVGVPVGEAAPESTGLDVFKQPAAQGMGF